MTEIVVEELSENNSDDWSTVYNSVMRRGLRFSPISSRMLEQIVRSLKPYNIKYLVAYENGIPSGICSYSKKDDNVFRIVDFCVLPHGEKPGTILVDMMLSEARAREYEIMSCWLPLSAPKSLDVLAEYLFNAGDSRVLMRHFLTESPRGPKQEISEYPEIDSEPSVLPFETGFQMYSLLESLKTSWYHAATINNTISQNSGIEVYLSTKMNRQGWIFPTCEALAPIDVDILSAALSYLYDAGVRDVLTESEGAMQWQKSFREYSFKEICTQFELSFDLMH
ncbi:MAG: hypothetical protein P1Q69_13405 [Candidatus Thorarchaeota archaeon]|nr:hypothetical protein [Candidatus Thorarchaeota archaeon]